MQFYKIFTTFQTKTKIITTDGLKIHSSTVGVDRILVELVTIILPLTLDSLPAFYED